MKPTKRELMEHAQRVGLIGKVVQYDCALPQLLVDEITQKCAESGGRHGVDHTHFAYVYVNQSILGYLIALTPDGRAFLDEFPEYPSYAQTITPLESWLRCDDVPTTAPGAEPEEELYEWRLFVDLGRVYGEMTPTQELFLGVTEELPHCLRRRCATETAVANDIRQIRDYGLKVTKIERRPYERWDDVKPEDLT